MSKVTCGKASRRTVPKGVSPPTFTSNQVPIAASPLQFAVRYARNAQYLPFYVVIGDHAGDYAKQDRLQFDQWIPKGYPALLVQYKGRGLEWFDGDSLASGMNRGEAKDTVVSADIEEKHPSPTMRSKVPNFVSLLKIGDLSPGGASSACSWQIMRQSASA